MKPYDVPADDTMFEFGDGTEPGVFEVCRCLQNFVTSAMTLVDQSRVLYETMYKLDGIIPKYDDEIKDRFKENPLHQFIQNLRNMTVHYRLPVVVYSEQRKFGIGSASVSYQVYFRKADLLKYDKWNALARAFLENSGDKVDIASVARDYHHLVDDFHTWFAERQHEAHRQQFDHLDGLESQLRQIALDIRQRHKEKWSESFDERTSDQQPKG